jgi:acyl transferase domain-containing protein/acyl carrier protein/SAM-dependent methyltransferase
MSSQNSLKDLLEKIRNGEISSAEALGLYRDEQHEPEEQLTDETSRFSDSRVETIYCGSEWIPSAAADSSHAAAGACLLFGADEQLLSGLRDIKEVSPVILVQRGASYQQLGEFRYRINPAHKEDFERLFTALNERRLALVYAINLWPFDDAGDTQERAVTAALNPLLYLSQTILKQKPSARTTLLHLFPDSNTNQQALHAAISGFARSLYLENPQLVCRAIEVHPRTNIPDVVRRELFEPATDQAQVRYQNGVRFVSRLTELKPETDTRTVSIQQNSVYVITGGLGALGLIFARHLAQKSNVRLALAGRAPLDTERQASIHKLESSGAEVVYFQTDISDRHAVNDLVQKTRSRFGRIDGVIHSAGIIRDGFLFNKSDAAIAAVLAPKIAGAIHLDEALKDERLDFFVLFSSLVAVTGNAGQADYAYANSFLDHFATVREQLRLEQKRHGRCLSINWPLWREGGMAVSEEAKRHAERLSGLVPLETDAGLRAFEQALDTRQSHVLVLSGDVEKLRVAYCLDGRSSTQADDALDTITSPVTEDERKHLQETAENYLKSVLSREVKLPAAKLQSNQPLEKYGIDSMMIMNATHDIEETFGTLPKTLFFEYQNIAELAQYFVENHAAKLAHLALQSLPQHTTHIAKDEVEITESARQFLLHTNHKNGNGNGHKNGNGNGHQHDAVKTADSHLVSTEEDVAIIGVAGRYPGAETPEEFWENLKSGKDSITEIPSERWDLGSFFDPDKEKQGKSYSKWGGFIDDVDKFDPLFFNISPREAELMDPQERLFLETAWQTFEDAGYTRGRLAGAKAGVFVGVMYAHYQLFAAEETLKGNTVAPGNFFASIANRVSYFFNLRGPSIALDTLCSSSLTAIHLACESIKRGEIDLALAGGVNVTIHPSKYFNLSTGKFASSDGRCRSFGEGGDGYVPGEGVGAILLKRLSTAIADGDYIYATIKKTTINHGGKTNGVTVPNPNAQSEVIAETLSKAGIEPRKISYLEAHGTGTALGDPIEIAGLTKAFRKLSAKQYARDNQYCAIGSVKSNIGHLESAAGIAGITKVLLQMKHGQLVPSLHSERLNPNIDFASSPFYVQRQLGYWTRPVLHESDEVSVSPRMAGVSSFGAGGANAHILLEEYIQPLSEVADRSTTSHLVLLSARNRDRLKAYATKLSRFLKQQSSDVDSELLANLAFTLQVGREHMQERLAVIAGNLEQLIARLDQYARGEQTADSYSANVNDNLIESEALIESRDLQKLAQGWVAGAEIDWDRFNENSGVRRIPLPTYPFARDHYWLPASEKSFTTGAPAKLHPLLGSNTSDLDEQKFTTRFSGNEFFLTHHIIKGRMLLPGVAVLEMARAAGELAANRPVRRITNTTWSSPVVFTPHGENEINISLYPSGDDVAYQVWSSRDGAREVHAEGELAFEDGQTPHTRSVDLEGVLARCPDGLNSEECYQQFQQHGFNYGPGFRSIKELFFNKTEAVARLQLPDSLEREFRSFNLHPSLLDGALQTVLGLLKPEDDNQTVYVPFALGEIEQHQPLTQTVYAHVTFSQNDQPDGSRKFNLSIIDESGAPLVAIRDFAVKPLNARQAHDNQPETSECLLYYPSWKEKPITRTSLVEPRSDRPEPVLIFDTVAEVRDALAQQLTVGARPIRPILVERGDQFADLGNDRYIINPIARTDYRQLLDALSKHDLQPARILHLWSCRDARHAEIHEQLKPGFYSVLYLTQALMQQRLDGPVGLLYVHPDSEPAFAAVSGLSKTIRLENPKFLYRNLALDESQLQIENIVAEFQQGSDVETRYEGKQRQVRTWTEYDSTSNSQFDLSAIKHDGVYLITGGAGGLGLVFAEYLAHQANARLVLTGRSELSADKEAHLRALDGSGTRIIYRRADVSCRADVESLLAETKSRFGVLNGVLHAAGVTRDAFVLNKSDEEIAAVIAPKIYGTICLDEVTANEPLDFFVVFSSAAGALGNIGQSDYSYANSFADHFAARREALRRHGKRSGKTLSIDWPLWEEGGLQTSASARETMRETTGLVPLKTVEGLKAFELSLQSPHTQLLALAGDRNKINQLVNPSKTVTKPEERPSSHSTTTVVDDELVRQLDAYLKGILSKELKLPVDKISSRERLEEYGIDSVIVMNMTRQLEKQFGELSKTLFFEYRTIAELNTYFVKHHRNAVETLAGVARSTSIPEPISVRRARFQARVSESITSDDIAIIGISGRYPMANDLTQFWENLKSGKDCITEVPRERWSGETKGNRQWGGFLDDVDKFDSLFFNISPKEAKLMDPQERLFLEAVWHTIEDAGYTRESLEGVPTGVFAGVMYGHYQLWSVAENYSGTGYTPSSLHASIANRVSYVFNFQGPSIALDTMCSSSLTAIHLACASLRQGDCEVAIAGGVNVSIHPNKYRALSEAKFTSSDGRCRTFGAGGDGYVPGEGVGALMLKSLSKALADGDHVYGVIKASAINHGGRTNGYTVPNPTAQAAVIAEVLRKSKIDPRRISYVEAHGTGTSLGDPIEITGLIKAFSEIASEDRTDKQYCSIGSVKSNIGHLESAAGIAGVTKVLLQMKHGQLAPSLHSAQLNPHINFNASPFYVQQTLAPWKSSKVATGGDGEYPRQAGISSFGAGGSNAHLVIEEFKSSKATQSSVTEPQFITLSARNEERLKTYAGNLAEFFRKASHPSKPSQHVDETISQQVERELRHLAANILNIDLEEIDPTEAISAYLVDPVGLNSLADALGQRYDLELNPALFLEFPSLRALAQHLINEHGPKVNKHDRATDDTEVENHAAELSLVDLAYTLQVGREAMEERLAIVVSSVEELADKLSRFACGEQSITGLYIGNVRQNKQRSELLLDGKEGAAFIQTVIEERKWEKLAQLWLLGVEVDWSLLHCKADGSREQRRRISLPTYPFARIRHWLPEATAVATKESPSTAHPLVDGVDTRQVLQQNRRIVFRKSLLASDRLIKDHAVLNRTILPGVGYLEMADAALSQVYDASEFYLARIVLLRPLVVSDEVRVQIVITEENNGLSFEIQSGEGESHARGEYRRTAEPDTEISTQQNVGEIKSRCHDEIPKEDLYEQFKAVGIEYGSYYQRIERVWGGDEEAVSLLTLPREYEHELSEYRIHPTMLDAALQTIAAVAINRRERHNLVLPFAVERVDVLRPLTARVYAHVKLIEQDRYDVTVLNESGQVCIRLRELSLKKAKPKNELPDFFYLPGWKPAPLEIGTSNLRNEDPAQSPQTVLLFQTPQASGLGKWLAALHEEDQVVWANLGNETRQISDSEWDIDTVDSANLDRMLGQLAGIDQIYFLGGVQTSDTNIADLAALEESQQLGVVSLFRIVKSLLRLGFERRPLRLNVITNQAHQVLPGEVVNPYAASLFGFVKSLAKECPQWSITSTDVSLNDGKHADLVDIVRALAAERGNANGDEVALRHGQRYVRCLTPVRLPATTGNPFRAEGVYLILGGAGGIGLEFSKYLARSVRARLVLVGRSELSDDQRRQIAEIESLGGTVLYVQGDATELASMQNVFAQARQHFGGVHGVIHSAIVLKDKTLANLNEEEFRAALLPKIQGSVNLYLAAANEPLDFLLFFSSAQSFSGNAGQSNYAAGCTFKDGFAQYLRQLVPYDVKTINWGYWGEVGVVSSAAYNRRLAAQGVGSITTEEGVEVVRRVLAHPVAQVMPIKLERHLLEALGVDLDQTVSLFPNDTSSLFDTALTHAREAARNPEELERSRTAFREVAVLGQHLLLAAFQGMGALVAAHETYERDSLRQQLRVAPNYYRLFDALLEILHRAGFVQLKGSVVTTPQKLDEPALQNSLAALADAKGQVVSSFPEVAPHVELLSACCAQYPALLKGEIRATEVMFPDSSTRLVEGVYRGNVVADSCNQHVAGSVRSYIAARLPQLSASEKIRIVEVGAGTGGTSTAVLSAISSYADRIEYLYTDLSTGLIQHAKRQFGPRYPFVEFRVLDIENDVQAQGCTAGGFDVVIGANVLHATRNLRKTIRNVKRLLKTNGWLVLNEVTEVQDFTTLTFGLLDGWWLFDDAEIRLPGAPLLSPALWERLLKEEGFKSVYTSGNSDDEDLGQHVIIAESNGQTIQLAMSHDKNVLPASTPRSSPTTTTATSQAPPLPAQTEPASQSTNLITTDPEDVLDHVRQTILQCVADALTMSPAEIDHDRQFSEYGVDSIIGVDLINVINTALGLTLRTTALFDYGNVKELAQFICDEHGHAIAAVANDATPQDTPDLALLEKLASGEIGSEQAYQILETHYGQL